MEYIEIQNTKLPKLGLGTWHMGVDSSKRDQEVGAVKYAIEKGLTHIDTAEMYSDGESERIVGEAIKGFKRDDLFITTKVHPSHIAVDDLVTAYDGSMKRLGIKDADLYLVHWPNPSIPLESTMRGMNYLWEHASRDLHIGVSNFSVEQMKEAQSHVSFKLFTNQVEYSLADLSPEDNGVLEYCQKNDMLLTAYSPLGQGALAMPGKHKELDEICDKYKKTPVQVALNYLISQPNIIAIPKSSSKEHIDEILGSADWELETEDIETLRKSFV
ncbi:MAG: aldo/keto reductase [bacterium]|nr:aldo/keto reductase [bacterium]